MAAVGLALFYVGVLLFFCAWLTSLAAFFFLAPRTSRFEVFMRGWFQRKRDYTPSGWRLLQFSRLAGLTGLGLVVLSIAVRGQR